MPDVTDQEKRCLIRWYQGLPKQIKRLEHELANVSSDFYQSRSLTGVSCYNQEEIDQFQRSVSPEYGALEIIDHENAIKKRLIKLYSRYETFSHRAPRSLVTDECEPLSEEEQASYDEIVAIEQEHQQRVQAEYDALEPSPTITLESVLGELYVD